jgi:hypothetical protein
VHDDHVGVSDRGQPGAHRVGTSGTTGDDDVGTLTIAVVVVGHHEDDGGRDRSG